MKKAKKLKIVVTQKNEQGISSKTVVNKTRDQLMQLEKDNQDIQLQVQVVKNVATLTLDIQMDVDAFTLKDHQLTKQLTSIQINNYTSTEYDNTFCCQFLKKNKKGYSIYLLGKSGEPKCSQPVLIQLVSKYFKDEKQESEMVQLQTDSEGKVTLGELEDIEWIYSIVKGEKENVKCDNRRWHIVPPSPIHYQPTYHLLHD